MPFLVSFYSLCSDMTFLYDEQPRKCTLYGRGQMEFGGSSHQFILHVWYPYRFTALS